MMNEFKAFAAATISVLLTGSALAGAAVGGCGASPAVISPGATDVPAAFRRALEQLPREGGVIRFAPGEYHLAERQATAMRFYISNHDQSKSHAVMFPVVGVTNLTVEATGALFLFAGRPIPWVVLDSRNVTLRGFAVDSEIPFLPELRITGFRGGKTLARLDRSVSPYAIRKGKIVFSGEGWEYPVLHAKLFDGQTRELVERTGDIPYCGAARELPTGELELDYDFAHRGKGAKVGDVVVLRPWERPSPAVFVYRSKDVTLRDVAIHSALGMALLAQRSENVSWLGSSDPETRTSGVFPRLATGRYASTHADATHFSNVAGEVRVENCLFEGMMDDAMNVHSTCLYVTNVVDATTLRCRYMHGQAIGFEVFQPGERLRFIDGETLETGPEVTVAEVKPLDAREVQLRLDRPLPSGWGAGDAVENADFQCAATFRGNIVRFNRARGTLFTTPKPVLVESNLFDRVSGCAVLCAGDAHYWFESGACRDVKIRGNVFRNCLTAIGMHGYCSGILTFFPEVHKIAGQRRRYHRNILIEDNRFDTFDVPFVYGLSVDGLTYRRNRTVRNARYRATYKPPFKFDHCEHIRIDDPFYLEDRRISVKSSLDGTMQPSYFIPAANATPTKPAPLLVCFHTWSYTMRELPQVYFGAIEFCRERGWSLLCPNFRGPNNTPQGCGSDLATGDIKDAIDYVKAHYPIDADRVYAIGASGGGHMTLLLAGRYPEIWAGCAAFCPPADLVAWHAASKALKQCYWEHLEKACGGPPEARRDEYLHRSPLTYAKTIRERGVNVMLITGIHDGHPGKGSVPVSIVTRMYNAMAAEADRVSEALIPRLDSEERAPAEEIARWRGVDPFYGADNFIHLRRTSGNVQYTIFEGGHGGNEEAALWWLERQRRGVAADWTLPKRANKSNYREFTK